jgi:hypothetical protein
LVLLRRGTIDARSLKPPVKEDEVDREKRLTSAKKHKTVQDTEKKKEKKEESHLAGARGASGSSEA